MATVNQIRIGALACSSIAKRRVLPILKQSELFELAAVASRDSDKSQSVAAEFSCAAQGYDELIEDQTIDAVYISLPVSLHYEWARKCLKAGKHILVEKTFMDSFSKTKEILALASSKQRVAMEALSYSYHPHYQRVQNLIRSSSIGNVRNIEAQFGFPYLSESDIRNQPELGGGAILDAFIYPLSFCLDTAQSLPQQIHYIVGRRDNRSVDTHGSIQLDFGTCSAQISYGFGFMYRNEYRVWGSTGILWAERVFSRPPTLAGDISLKLQGDTKIETVDPADQFEKMLNRFHSEITTPGDFLLSESQKLLDRSWIISTIRDRALDAFRNNPGDVQIHGCLEMPTGQTV